MLQLQLQQTGKGNSGWGEFDTLHVKATPAEALLRAVASYLCGDGSLQVQMCFQGID